MENEYYCLYQNEGIVFQSIGSDVEWLKRIVSALSKDENTSVYKIKIEKLEEVIK